MRKIQVFILCLCVVLSSSELIGPDSRKQTEKNNEEEDTQKVEERNKVDPEYLKELEEAVNQELSEAMSEELLTFKDYADAVRSTKDMKENQLKQMEFTLKLLKSSIMKSSKLSYQDLKMTEEAANHEKLEEENPQDLLDTLPPLPEDQEEELTPELKEAKELYDEAIKKLHRRTPDLQNTILQVKAAADAGYIPAKVKLAWSHIFGEGVELDVDKAKDIFEKLAADGNADAHAGMGFLYASGIGVPVSQAKALVHYTLGALGDSSYAQMALAYRHWAGLTVPSSCPKALDLYMKVASKVASEVTFSGGPAVVRTRLADEAEGSGGGALDTDLIEYYQLLAEKGDVQAQVGLGQLHFQGGRGVTLDLNKAHHYFSQAAKTGNAVANALLGKGGSPPATGAAGAGAGAGLPALTGEELRLVRAVRAQYARRGGFVRIFPSQNSWQKYSQYLDPVSGIPVCSTSLNNNIPYQVVAHNYNLLVHSHVLPHFQHATVATSLTHTPQRLQRYEAVTITSTAPAISLGEPNPTPRLDSRRAKELVKRQLNEGLRLTMGEGRRAFGLYLTHVLKRISSPNNELAVSHAGLVLKFLKRASASLRMPYNVKGPTAKMCDKDRCAVIAKQLNDFLYMYYRETDLYTDSEDRDGCVSNINFAQFLYSASEADLEDVLLLLLRTENYHATFLGDTRNPYCVDLPSHRLAADARHTLLHHLAALQPVNTRKYRPSIDSQSRSEQDETSNSVQDSGGSSPPPFSNSDVVLKESMKQEKPLNLALKYARS